MKFIFSICIVLYHMYRMLLGRKKFAMISLGYILVDFFFIVSGYFFYNSVLKIKKKADIYHENINSTKKRLIRFLPYSVIIWVIGSIVLFFNNKISYSETLLGFFNTFLFDMSGVNGYLMNGSLWYLSSLIILFFILTPIIYNNKDKFSKYFAPIIILFGLGYLYQRSEHLNVFSTGWNVIVYDGLVRALVDINIGIVVYEISNYIKEYIKNSKLKVIILNIIQLILYALLFGFIIFYKNSGRCDYLVLIVISLALTTTFSSDYLGGKLDFSITRYLEKLSLPIFINHFVIITLMNVFCGQKNLFIVNVIICLAITITFSIIEMFIIDKVMKKLKLLK